MDLITVSKPGSGAQGAFLGNWEFLSQTNNNSNSVPQEDRFKYVDDLSIVEIVNLKSVTYNKQNQCNLVLCNHT